MTEQRVALVTGANKGIGFAIARALLGQGTVVFWAPAPPHAASAAVELRGAGPGARFVHLDVTDPASAAAAADRIDREERVLDILVNNAGIVVRPVHPPSQTPVPDAAREPPPESYRQPLSAGLPRTRLPS